MAKKSTQKAEQIHVFGSEVQYEFEVKVSKEHTVTVSKQVMFVVNSNTTGESRAGPWFISGGGDVCVCDTLEKAKRVAQALVDSLGRT